MPASKKSAAIELSHVLTPSINSSLLLNPSCAKLVIAYPIYDNLVENSE
jgi:hypothetical protein